MRNAHPRTLKVFETSTGREPFNEWLKSIPDQTTRHRIQRRVDRLETGNFGDSRPVGEGVSELRQDFRPGHRIYFGEADNTTVILLCAGDKSSQTRDIAQAKTYWREYRETH